jgi:RNA polymerase I-specific transcription initiation factor RRN7
MLPDPVPEEAYQDLEPQLEDKEGDRDEGAKASAGDADEQSPKGEDDEASSEEEEKEEELGSELEALMRENSDFSSSSSSDEKQAAIPSTKKRGKAKRKKGRSSYDRPVSTLAVLVVACWIMRVPAMYRDFTWSVFFVNISKILNCTEGWNDYWCEWDGNFKKGLSRVTSCPTWIR